jgi:hypothetical protein
MVDLFKQHSYTVRLLSYFCGLALALSFLVSATSHLYAASAKPLAVRHAIDPRFTSTGTSTKSINWAGYVAIDQPHTFLKAKLTFEIPTLKGEADFNKVVSIWAGLGGVDSNIVPSLVQTGIDSLIVPADVTHSEPYQVNQAWFEDYPQPPLFITFTNPQSLSAGDSITVDIQSELGRHQTRVQDRFSIQDQTSGETQSGALTITDTSFQTDGASAECIVERPAFISQIGIQLSSLPQFGTANLSDCQVSNDTNQDTHNDGDLSAIGNSTHLLRVDMVNEKNEVLAQTSSLTHNKDFNVIWEGAQ